MAVVAADPEVVTEAFRTFDLAGGGMISRDDLTTLLQKLDPSTMSDHRVNLLINEFDANCVGTVDYSQFIMWLLAGYCVEGVAGGGEDGQELPKLTCGDPPSMWAGWNRCDRGAGPCPQVLWLDVGTLQVLGAGSTDCNGIYKGSASNGFEHASGRATVTWDSEFRRFQIVARQAARYFTNIVLPPLAETEGSDAGKDPPSTNPDDADRADEWGGWVAESVGRLPLPRVAWLGHGTLQVIGAGCSDCNGGYKLAPDGHFEHASGKATVARNPETGRFEIAVARGGAQAPAYSTYSTGIAPSADFVASAGGRCGNGLAQA